MPEEASSTKLEVSGLWKSYGPTRALQGVELSVADGEFVTLLGPSGSGKTTLLHTVAGLVRPDRGEIRIDGRPVTSVPPYERDIGVVFQSYALFPHMTTADNVAFPLRMRDVGREEAAAEARRALDLVRLSGLGERYPDQLSGGQQQRVALARALVHEPSIVLMDEPLGALDMKLRDYLRLEIKRIQSELDIAVLYVTHDQEEALVMSDRICLIAGGRIEQDGTPEDLYFRPANRFVADFLGESNLLEAEVAEREGERVVARLPSGAELEGVIGEATPGQEEVRAGEAVLLMIRPESVRVLRDGESTDNTVEARLRETVMTGDTLRLLFALRDGGELRAKALTGGPVGGERGGGGAVRLGWSRERTVVLPREREPEGG